MIVQCAACQARFKIADDKVTDRGVKVRCRKCATVFVVHKDAAPAPDAPPLGRAETGVRPAPPPQAAAFQGPPQASPFPAAVRPQPLAPQPAPAPKPGLPDAFRRFQTKELGADPFQQPQKLARPDPFGGLEVATAPAFQPGQQQPAAPSQLPDPFASLDLGGSPIRTPESFGEPTVRRDISPALAQLSKPQPPAADPFLSATVRKTLPPQAVAAAKAAASRDPFAIDLGVPAAPPPAASADPFANIDLGGPPAPAPAPVRAPAPQAAASADPFANIDVGAPAPQGQGFGSIDFGAAPPQPAPQPAPAASADPFANIDVGAPPTQGFGSLDFGGPPSAPPHATPSPRAVPAAALQPTAPPSRPAPAASSDPFAGVSLDGALAAALPPSPGMPAAPGMPGGGMLDDLGSIDLSPPEAGFGEEPQEPQAAPQAAQQAQADPAEPRTVVKSVKWDGDKLEVKSPAAAYAAQLLSKKAAQRPRRSLIASLLMALAFLAVGGFVLERTARAVKAHGAAPSTPAARLAVSDLSSTYYLTREGRPVFLVRGKLANRTEERQTPAVKVTVELRRGDSVERSADAYAGVLPDLEDIYLTSGPLEVAEVVQRASSRAGPVEPGAVAEFLGVFGEFPDEISDLTVHAVAAAAPAPPPPAARTGVDLRASPGRLDGAKAGTRPVPPAGKAADPKGVKDAARPPTEFPMDDPKRPARPAAPEPKLRAPVPMVDDGKAEPAKAAEPVKSPPPKKFEFPMDDPKRPLKLESGPPPAKAEPARAP